VDSRTRRLRRHQSTRPEWQRPRGLRQIAVASVRGPQRRAAPSAEARRASTVVRTCDRPTRPSMSCTSCTARPPRARTIGAGIASHRPRRLALRRAQRERPD
jgi:hypothetical protein